VAGVQAQTAFRDTPEAAVRQHAGLLPLRERLALLRARTSAGGGLLAQARLLLPEWFVATSAAGRRRKVRRRPAGSGA
jgi:hypothetical protein